MNLQEKRNEELILVTLLKTATGQSQYLTNEYKQTEKFYFKVLQNTLYSFIEDFEKGIKAQEEEFIINLTDIYHNINNHARKQLKGESEIDSVVLTIDELHEAYLNLGECEKEIFLNKINARKKEFL